MAFSTSWSNRSARWRRGESSRQRSTGGATPVFLPMPMAPSAWRPPRLSGSTSGHGPHHQERFGAPRHGVRQLGVEEFVGQILFAGEEPDERPALLRDLI